MPFQLFNTIIDKFWYPKGITNYSIFLVRPYINNMLIKPGVLILWVVQYLLYIIIFKSYSIVLILTIIRHQIRHLINIYSGK